MHQSDAEMKKIAPVIDVGLFRKYIAYARRNIKPVLKANTRRRSVNTTSP